MSEPIQINPKKISILNPNESEVELFESRIQFKSFWPRIHSD